MTTESIPGGGGGTPLGYPFLGLTCPGHRGSFRPGRGVAMAWDVRGKNVLVTGATSGIGYTLSLHDALPI